MKRAGGDLCDRDAKKMGIDSEVGRMERQRLGEAQIAQEMFRRVAFQGQAHVHLHNAIRELRRTTRRTVHYSPYGAIIQTSGSGKTRSVLQTSTLGVYVCYCSLAGAGSSAYPRRTPHLADMLSSTTEELPAVLYFKAWLTVLDKALESGVKAEAWKEMQLDDQGDGIYKQVMEVWTRMIGVEGNRSMEGVSDRDAVNTTILADVVRSVRKRISSSTKPQLASVLFVFDEARGLTVTKDDVPFSQSAFCQVRRALRAFFRGVEFFGLMLDTAAKMCNLQPIRSAEDSDRAVRAGFKLLPPIYRLFDLKMHLPEPKKSFEEYTRPSTWMRYGRPLWAARMDREGSSEHALGNLLQLAQQKLVGTLHGDFQGQAVDLEAGKMTQSQAMALLGAAVGLVICPRSMLAQTLAASHMNVVLRVSEDRSRVFVSLPAEPILAEAAACLLSSSIVQEKALVEMEAACMAGYVTPGPRGEFVVKFILVAAIWSIKEKSLADWFLQPIPVLDYLEELLMSNGETFEELKARLPEGGVVFFNSFVTVHQPPDAAMLGMCFAGGHGIMYRAESNLPGSDMIIPVWTPLGMTAIVVSVKNLGRAGCLEAVSADELKCELPEVGVVDNLPVVTLLMSLQEPKLRSPTDWILWEQGVHVTCYGIQHNYGFLSKAVKSMLKNMLVTVPDAYATGAGDDRKWIESVLPFEFQQPNKNFAQIDLQV